MRKLLLLVALSLMAFAGFAPASFAELEGPADPIIVTDGVKDESGLPCGEVTRSGHGAVGGGCEVVAWTGEHGLTDMSTHTIFGTFPIADCSNEFTGYVDGDGEGWIDMDEIEVGHAPEGGHTSNCGDDSRTGPPNHHYTTEDDGIDNCSETAAEGVNHPGDWHLQGYEDAAGNDFWMQVELCLENTPSGTIFGHLWIRVETDPADGEVVGFESQAHRLTEENATGNPEFTGHWDVETDVGDHIFIDD